MAPRSDWVWRAGASRNSEKSDEQKDAIPPKVNRPYTRGRGRDAPGRGRPASTAGKGRPNHTRARKMCRLCTSKVIRKKAKRGTAEESGMRNQIGVNYVKRRKEKGEGGPPGIIVSLWETS